MNGAVELYKACNKQGIKPILGLEAYFVDDRTVREGKIERNHLTLIAQSDEGFRNLVKLSSGGFLEGLYRGKPGVDMELLARHSEGVIALTGCLASRSSRRIVEGRPDEARAHLDELVQVFGPEDVYFEIQHNGVPEQEKVNEAIQRFADEMGRPLVATADVHYLRREDYHHHAALLCVQTKSTLAAPKMSFDTNEFYLKSSEEMAQSFADMPEALASTLEIAERCDTSIALGQQLIPRYETPDGESEEAYVRALVDRGLRKRYGDPIPAAARERADMELAVIGNMGFNAYFLIVWDFVAYAKANGIAVGPGRGSAAGSIIAYSLEITDVDPIRYDLLFERFLNPGRKSMPDIDIDFAVDGRERVINYVAEKYGRDRVAQIITFSTMAARAAVRDAGRVLEVPYGVVDRVAKLIPEGPGQTLESCLKPGQPLRQEYDADPTAREIVDLARPLEGLVRQDSIHAAGVVIADRPLTDVIPLQQKGADQEVVTQLAMGDVVDLGLLKIDFLGLRNLDVIDKASRLVGGLDIERLPLDDRKTYEMLARGDSIGVFQFEGSGMREALRQVKPTVFEDLVALVALYRPGPMAYIPLYARRKHGKEPITFIDRRLEPITRGSYGICIYQEQYMRIAKEIAGFTPAEAETLRKAIGKKIHSLMASLKEKFLEGCAQTGTTPAVANQLWKDMEQSQDYSFNKAHAACYALIAYRTAWLKANHACEYMAALISSVMNTKDKVPYYANACAELGIEVLPPDVNSSQVDFAVVEGKIRFGLNAVKNVGESAAGAIVRERAENGPFESIWDFTERVDPQVSNKRVLEALVKCGGLDSTGDSRRGMLGVLDQAALWGQKQQQDRLAGQGSIFDLGPQEAQRPRHHPVVPTGEFDKKELLALEKESLGLYVSEHPLAAVRDQLRKRTDCALGDIAARRDGEVVTVGGIVGAIKPLTTKKGEPMIFLTLDDVGGSAEVVVFNSVYAASRELCEVDRILVVKGRVDHKQAGETKLLAMEVAPFEATRERKIVTLKVDPRRADAGIVRQLRDLIVRYPGQAPVFLELTGESGFRRLEFGPGFRVAPDSDFFAEAKTLLGEAAVV